MRGSAVSHPDRLSRRTRFSSSIALTGVCTPFSASTTAFCVIELTFDVAWLWSALHAAIIFAGPIVQPQRQPVIAYAFDAEPQTTAASGQSSARILGRLCGTGS